MAEINPGDPSFTLTEALHAVNIAMYLTDLANATADGFFALGLTVDSSGYVVQTTAST